VDFGPVCPFYQLNKKGVEANVDGPCTVLYRNNTVTYAYQKHAVRCTYCKEDGTSPWSKDNFCPASVLTPNATILHNGTATLTTDLWTYEWYQNSFITLRNYRNWYMKPGTNIPLRVAEDLGTGFTDFTSYEEVPFPGVPDSELMAGMEDMEEYHIHGIRGEQKGCRGRDQRCDGIPVEEWECTSEAGVNTRKSWPLNGNVVPKRC